jgi:hypothetical protein
MALKISSRDCLRCGEPFFGYMPSSSKRKYCSASCVWKGRKQSPEHIANRTKDGEMHQNWKGNDIAVRSGRTRALRKFPIPDRCEKCRRVGRLDRHHKDDNTANNERSNISFLCRKCHMTVDGRINRMGDVARGYSMR